MTNLDIFKIGVGPSSSHTLGPLVAGNMFAEKLAKNGALLRTCRIEITLYGSLSLTGLGHLTDKAVIWGLFGVRAKELTADIQAQIIAAANDKNELNLNGEKIINFNPQTDLIFSKEFKRLHENALKITAFDEAGGLIDSEVYYSVGGGFVKNEASFNAHAHAAAHQNLWEVPTATAALKMCDEKGINLAQLSLHYELQTRPEHEITEYCLDCWEVMQEAYYAGTHPATPQLPGPLRLHRRAPGLAQRVSLTTDPMGIVDFISLYAIAVAEENGGGGRVVTAPTMGACAVIPAVMLYLKNHTVGFNEQKAVEFLLTAALIGSFYRRNASISGAEAGCQAEIGAASSMAAAAMATVLGASARTACNAAEVAMEHHLGLTCDPVGGLVQIPCIERNAFGAIKAITAARMAMTRKSVPLISLDDVIRTMYQTGKDMSTKYKETALGGLASLNIC